MHHNLLIFITTETYHRSIQHTHNHWLTELDLSQISISGRTQPRVSLSLTSSDKSWRLLLELLGRARGRASGSKGGWTTIRTDWCPSCSISRAKTLRRRACGSSFTGRTTSTGSACTPHRIETLMTLEVLYLWFCKYCMAIMNWQSQWFANSNNVLLFVFSCVTSDNWCNSIANFNCCCVLGLIHGVQAPFIFWVALWMKGQKLCHQNTLALAHCARN